jgi:glycosyltransferase involved in cell wall biosynthesis
MPIGQAIDTDVFRYVPLRRGDGAIRILALGRTSRSKRFDAIIRAVAMALGKGMPLRLRVVGPSTMPHETEHRRQLLGLVDSLGVSEKVTLEDGVPYASIPELLREADVLVNGMVAGSGDKVVFEAMATGRPVLASNPVFADLLSGLPIQLTFREGDPNDLAERIGEFVGTPAEIRERAGRTLRNRVEADHSLRHWGRAIADVVRGLRH